MATCSWSGGFIALIAFLALVAIGVTAIPLALFLVLLIAMALTALYGWTVERFAYRPLRHSFRLAPLISAIGMSIILHELRADRAGRARQAAAAADHRRPHADRERDASTCSFPTSRSSSCVTTLALMLVFSWHRGEDPARPRHARLRAGPEDGLAARRRHRPHDLAHLRDRRGARLGRRHHVPALLRRDRLLHRLRRRREGVHRGGAGRHRLAARRDARRPADRPDRDVLVGLFLDRVQGRRRLLRS